MAVVCTLVVALAACSSEPGSGARDEPGVAGEMQVTEEPIQTPTPTLDDKRALVVRELRSMTELETSVYSLEKVVEAEREGDGFLGFLGDEKLLLIAHGVVAAGVDLSTLDESDVEVSDERTVSVTLPETAIIDLTLVEDDTRIIDRDTGLLAEEDAGLESEALDQAEVQILESACEQGILEDAAEDAQARVSTVLGFLDFDSVTVEAPVGSCEGVSGN